MKEKLIIIGAGGHARSVIDILLQNSDYKIIGCIDNQYPKIKNVPKMDDIPIIGCDDMLQEIFDSNIKKVFVAIGNNKIRAEIYKHVKQIGYTVIKVISKNAFISSKVQIGNGTCIMAGAVININTQIGENCIINTNCSLDHDCLIGDHCHIAPGVTISGTTSIGDFTQIGTGACIIDGITIGSNSFVGAGASVVKNIPNNVLAYGVPARIIKNI